MKQAKHTPGPWNTEQHKSKDHPTCTDFDIWNQNTHIATIHEHVDDVQTDVANARLISEAPLMLEILECITQTCCDDAAKIAGIQERAKLILAKARGES